MPYCIAQSLPHKKTRKINYAYAVHLCICGYYIKYKQFHSSSQDTYSTVGNSLWGGQNIEATDI